VKIAAKTGLMELIVKTGMANAIASQLGGLKGNKNAVAETIENNVRRTIVKEHLNDPAYYEKMSALLDEIIAARKAKTIEYEEYLKRIAELAKRVDAGHAYDIPEQLKKSPALSLELLRARAAPSVERSSGRGRMLPHQQVPPLRWWIEMPTDRPCEEGALSYRKRRGRGSHPIPCVIPRRRRSGARDV
jgi:hypothetical protein